MKKSFYIILSILLVGCASEKTDYSKMPYKDIPSSEFEKLSPKEQYSIKYRDVPENTLIVECYKKDTIYAEDGSMLKTEYVKDTFNIILSNDTMYFGVKQKCKDPKLSITATQDLYVKESKTFTKYVSLTPKYDRRKHVYYLLRSQFPHFERDNFGVAVSTIRFEWEPAKLKFDYDLTSKNNHYVYSFTESQIVYRGTYGTLAGKPFPEKDEFMCEQNQISAFLRWVTGDLTYENQLTK